MDYGDQSSKIDSEVKDLWGNVKSISSSNFNGFWSGSAHDNLTSSLDTAVSNVSTQISLVNDFIGAVAKLAEYKECKEKIDANNSEMAGLDSVKDAAKISSLESENSNLESKKDSLRSEIESVISSITPVSSQGILISI